MPNENELKTGENDINIFIFLSKQRTDWINLDWDTENECKGKAGEQGRTTWTNKKNWTLKWYA